MFPSLQQHTKLGHHHASRHGAWRQGWPQAAACRAHLGPVRATPMKKCMSFLAIWPSFIPCVFKISLFFLRQLKSLWQQKPPAKDTSNGSQSSRRPLSPCPSVTGNPISNLCHWCVDPKCSPLGDVSEFETQSVLNRNSSKVSLLLNHFHLRDSQRAPETEAFWKMPLNTFKIPKIEGSSSLPGNFRLLFFPAILFILPLFHHFELNHPTTQPPNLSYPKKPCKIRRVSTCKESRFKAQLPQPLRNCCWKANSSSTESKKVSITCR